MWHPLTKTKFQYLKTKIINTHLTHSHNFKLPRRMFNRLVAIDFLIKQFVGCMWLLDASEQRNNKVVTGWWWSVNPVSTHFHTYTAESNVQLCCPAVIQAHAAVVTNTCTHSTHTDTLTECHQRSSPVSAPSVNLRKSLTLELTHTSAQRHPILTRWETPMCDMSDISHPYTAHQSVHSLKHSLTDISVIITWQCVCVCTKHFTASSGRMCAHIHTQRKAQICLIVTSHNIL